MTPTPSNTPKDRAHRVEVFLATLLRSGVVVSLFLIVMGVTVMFLRHPEFLSDPNELKHLRAIETETNMPNQFSQVVQNLLEGSGRAIITLGLLVLIATPVVRVLASAMSFAFDRDWKYTALTTAVLLVLLISFLLGKAG